MNNKLVRKFVEFGIGNFIVLITGFISSPIITRLVVPEEFGKFSMFNTLTSLFVFVLMLGLDQAYVRFFYEEDEELRGKLLAKAVRIPLLINLVLSIVLLLLYKPISNIIIGKYSIALMLVIIVQNTFNIINRFSVLVVRMQQKGKTYSFLQVIGRVSYILFIIGSFKFFENDYRTLVFGAVLSNVIVAVIAVIIEKKQWLAFNNERELKIPIKEMIRFGTPLIFSMSITWVFQSMDKFFVSGYNGYVELGIYSSAFTIVSLLNSVQESFVTFWAPLANEKYNEDINNTSFFEKINSIVSLIMLLIGIGMIVFKDIFVMLLGESYREASMIFPFLILMPIMFTISETTVIGINFKKKTKHHITISIIAAVVNLFGNIVLVPKLGAKGAAISTGISYIVFFVARTIVSTRLYKVNYNLKRLFISLSGVLTVAFYGSFNKVNLTLIILSIIATVITVVAYRGIIIEIFNSIKNRKVKY